VAAHKAVNAIAGIVGVELDDAAEMLCAQFVFQNFDFRF
jgi:hypothetical protein